MRFFTQVLALALLANCTAQTGGYQAPEFGAAPPGAPDGTCWGRLETPAVIETVTEQVLVQPAVLGANGQVVRPASYRTETRQNIIKERSQRWFETPCPVQMSQAFVESLQRALAVRGLYAGQITGQMDARTQAAVRQWQQARGLDSGMLSLETARALGLVAVARNG